MSNHLMCVVNKPVCTHNVNGACNFGEHCHTCVPQCDGCNKVLESISKKFCSSYPLPETQWRKGRICPLASHTFTADETVLKINPLKASKRLWG